MCRSRLHYVALVSHMVATKANTRTVTRKDYELPSYGLDRNETCSPHPQGMRERYGEVVRTGPNMVSFSNPEAIPTVYPTRPGFPKVCIRILVKSTKQIGRRITKL